MLMPMLGLLATNVLTVKVEANTGFSFPWANGVSWEWWDRGANYPTWHNGEDRRCDSENPSVIPPRCALDFGFKNSTTNKNVHAIADGVVTKVINCTSTSNISISHGGVVVDYYHLTKSSVTNLGITKDKVIKKYDNLGEVKTGKYTEKCGDYTFYADQQPASGHLHLVMPTDLFKLDGWNFIFPKQTAQHSSGEVRSVNGSFVSNNKREISPVVACRPDTSCPVYRFHHPVKKRHFYTISAEEKNYVEMNNPNWKFETVAFYAHNSTIGNGQTLNVSPVYRFWSDSKQAHFYTISADERDLIIKNDKSWKYETIAYYAFKTQVPGTVPLYRFWSNEYQTHFFTANEDEKKVIINTNPNWRYEGIAYYVKN